MPVSRCARDFLKRHDLVEATPRPASRLDIGALLVHRLPIQSPPKPSQESLRGLDGCEPPDRAVTRPWPEEQVSDE